MFGCVWVGFNHKPSKYSKHNVKFCCNINKGNNILRFHVILVNQRLIPWHERCVLREHISYFFCLSVFCICSQCFCLRSAMSQFQPDKYVWLVRASDLWRYKSICDEKQKPQSCLVSIDTCLQQELKHVKKETQTRKNRLKNIYILDYRKCVEFKHMPLWLVDPLGNTFPYQFSTNEKAYQFYYMTQRTRLKSRPKTQIERG